MKRTLALATFAIAASLAVSAQAQTITSIQFVNPNGNANNLPITPAQVAGVDAVANWNIGPTSNFYVYTGSNGETDTNSGSLITSSGGTSAIGYNVLSAGGAYYPGNSVTSPAGNAAMLQGGVTAVGTNTGGYYPGSANLTISGLAIGDNYTFIVYVGGPQYLLGEASISDAFLGNTLYFASPNGGFAATPVTTLVNNASTNDFSVTDANNPGAVSTNYATNYVEFSGITGVTSDTVSLTEIGSWPNGAFLSGTAGSMAMTISAIQVVDNVPEPSTYAMMVGGLGMLLAGQRIRRNLKS